MVVLGPNIIENGVNPETAIFGCGDGMGMLGPARGPEDQNPDPITRLFVVLGKLLAVRRVLEPLVADTAYGRGRIEHPITEIGSVQASHIGYEEPDVFNVIWQPLVATVSRDVIEPAGRAIADLDQRTRRFIAGETHTILAIDPRASVEQRMSDLNHYLLGKGLTVEASSGGFRDFIAGAFSGPRGERINLPTSSDPSFPDSWISAEKADPRGYGIRRLWSVIW